MADEFATIERQLASIMAYLTKVWWYDSEHDEWFVYSPDAPSDLYELVFGNEYYLYVTEPCTLLYDDLLMDLYEGWNSIIWGSDKVTAFIPQLRLEPGQSQLVKFRLSPSVVGTHNVGVDGLQGSFIAVKVPVP